MQALPRVMADYKGPLIANNGGMMADPRVQSFVITNDAHVRNSNPGYSRGNAGRPFCH